MPDGPGPSRGVKRQLLLPSEAAIPTGQFSIQTERTGMDLFLVGEKG